MSRETRRGRAEMGFNFRPGLRIAVGAMGLISGAWSAERSGPMAQQPATISWAAERSSLSVELSGAAV